MKLILAVNAAGAAVAGDVHGIAELELGQHRFVDEEAHLDIARRQQGDHRPAGRHHLADPEIDLLDRARDRAEDFATREPRLRRVEPRLRRAQSRLGFVQGSLRSGLGLEQCWARS